PRCPCTAASISELDRFLSRTGPRFASTVVFVVPPAVEEDWADTANVDAAGRLPYTEVRLDDGRLAETFGAKTSGAAFVFDTDGALLFHGGLTASRGHEGLSAGIDALGAIASGRRPAAPNCPVFGCRLFSAQT